MIEQNVTFPERNLNDNRMKLLSLACRYRSNVSLCSEHYKINAKSIMKIPQVEANVLYRLEIDGDDEFELTEKMRQLICSFDQSR